ncbi:MAG: hypothetical protein AAGU19_08380 [Prolixibacteraceae bacterium]
MKPLRLILLLTVAALILPSCVLKKDFVMMESAKLRAENRVRELTGENEAQASRIEEMIADFEKMKQELMASNAQKDQMIANLTGQINLLNSNVKEKDASLEEKLYTFEFEKKRMDVEMQKIRDSRTGLQNKNAGLQQDLDSIKNEMANLRFNLTRQDDGVKRLSEQAQLKDEKLKELQSELDSLNIRLREKDETISKLNNNVNLLKKELGK